MAAWIIQRDVADPALYVSTWLSDESVDVRSAEGQERSRRWLEHFRDHDVTGIGFGFVAIQRIADDEPSDVLAETMAQPVIDPLGPEVEEYFARIEWLRNLVPGELETKHVQLRQVSPAKTFHCPTRSLAWALSAQHYGSAARTVRAGSMTSTSTSRRSSPGSIPTG